MEGSLSHVKVLFLRSLGRGAARAGGAGALAASVMDHDVCVADELIIVAEAQAVAGGRTQPARRGVGRVGRTTARVDRPGELILILVPA